MNFRAYFHLIYTEIYIEIEPLLLTRPVMKVCYVM